MIVSSEQSRTPVRILGAIVIAGLTVAAARVSVTLPHSPVPMTLQTVVVLSAGAVIGPVFGTLAMALYLGAAALGLPVLEKGASGLDALTGPTAGYLLGFFVAPAVVGLAAGSPDLPRWNRAARIAIGVTLGTLGILGLGVAWLAYGVALGTARAIEVGLMPFIGAAVAKGVLATAVGMASDALRPKAAKPPDGDAGASAG